MKNITKLITISGWVVVIISFSLFFYFRYKEKKQPVIATQEKVIPTEVKGSEIKMTKEGDKWIVEDPTHLFGGYRQIKTKEEIKESPIAFLLIVLPTINKDYFLVGQTQVDLSKDPNKPISEPQYINVKETAKGSNEYCNDFNVYCFKKEGNYIIRENSFAKIKLKWEPLDKDDLDMLAKKGIILK